MRWLILGAWLIGSTALAADVTVDTSTNRRPISPLIYGINGGGDVQAARIGAGLRRLGGNIWSRYNWEASTSNEETSARSSSSSTCPMLQSSSGERSK